ncbi:hypothetical protein ACFE04_008676 [Oxalis oulophora]
MTGKAKPKKHTAKELAAKLDAATTNRGGGKAGLADRTGKEKGGHAKFECPHCKITAPDIKTMQIHHESKHPKIPYEEDKVTNLHAGTSTASSSIDTSKPKPGVRGSLKKSSESVDDETSKLSEIFDVYLSKGDIDGVRSSSMIVTGYNMFGLPKGTTEDWNHKKSVESSEQLYSIAFPQIEAQLYSIAFPQIQATSSGSWRGRSVCKYFKIEPKIMRYC